MTRQQIEAEYNVENGIIQDLGRFEGEAVYVPYFFSFYLDGCADEDENGNLTFDVDADDIAAFPELEGAAKVIIATSDSGFVSGWTE